MFISWKHDNIPTDYLHDNKHMKRRKIGVLVANFKDVLFNRENRPVFRQNNAPPKTPATQAQPSRVHHIASPSINHAGRIFVRHSSPEHTFAQPRPQAAYTIQPSYASVTRMPQPNKTSPANGNLPSLNINTVLELLRLYKFTRHSWVTIYILFALFFIHYHEELLCLRSMAILVGRVKWYRRAVRREGAEKSQGDWGENNEKPPARKGAFFESVRTPAYGSFRLNQIVRPSIKCLVIISAKQNQNIKEALTGALSTLNIQRENRATVMKPELEMAIYSLLQRRDVMAILPTGFGKSMIFPVFAMAKEEMSSLKTCMIPCFPLKSTIDDQISEMLTRSCTVMELTTATVNLLRESPPQFSLLLNVRE